MSGEMTPKQRSVYEMTAALYELIPYLERHGVLAVDEETAAAKARDFFDEMAPHYGWPEDWREHAHVDYLSLADADG
jgi:hypothetical protein